MACAAPTWIACLQLPVGQDSQSPGAGLSHSRCSVRKPVQLRVGPALRPTQTSPPCSATSQLAAQNPHCSVHCHTALSCSTTPCTLIPELLNDPISVQPKGPGGSHTADKLLLSDLTRLLWTHAHSAPLLILLQPAPNPPTGSGNPASRSYSRKMKTHGHTKPGTHMLTDT